MPLKHDFIDNFEAGQEEQEEQEEMFDEDPFGFNEMAN